MTHVEKTLKKLNAQFLKGLHAKMKAKGAGSLTEGITSKLTNNGFEVFATPAAKYASTGRKSGKMPSVKSLEPWAKKHSIPLKALYPIARSIGRKGTKGKHYLEDTDDLINNIQKQIADAAVEDVKEAIPNTKK